MKYVAYIAFVFNFLVWCGNVHASGKPIPLACQNSERSPERIVRFLCFQNRIYEIVYESKKSTIFLKFSGKKIALDKISARFNPELVGSDTFIGFLAPRLQAYKDSDIIMYVSSIRTNGGGGGGQCGAGAEIFLNFLNVSNGFPRKHSSILIGSCKESIEIFDQNMSDSELGEVFVDGDRLRIKFLNYKDAEGYPTAAISSDFKTLDFE